MKKVIKRDGNKQDFNVEKIKKAIKKASNSLEKEYQIPDEEIQEMAESISFEIADSNEIDIEKIQDLVEKELMENGHYEVAKSYILYRDQRAKERFKRTKIIKEIKQKLDGKVNEKQNANVDEESFGGRKGEGADLLVKEMALDYYVSPKVAKNHRENRIYIHDLNSYAVGLHNCLQLPLDDLLKNGVAVKDSDIRPAGSLNTAEQISAVFMQIQSLEQFGGVSYGSFDSAMVPYVRKSFQKHYKIGLKYIKHFSNEKINKFLKEPIKSIEEKHLKKNKEVYNYAMEQTINESDQAAEALFHNLNTLLSRSGSQLPFSSICFGTETSLEGKIVCNSIYKTSIKGIGKYGRTSIFPCQIFKYNKVVNGKKGTPNYSLFKNSIDSTTRRLYPNYANTHWSVQMKGINYDRNIKKSALLKLKQEDITTYHNLYNWIMNNPDEARRMNLAIDDCDVTVLEEIMPSEEFATMGCLSETEHLYIKLSNQIYDISIKDFYEFAKTGILKNARKADIFFNQERTENIGNRQIQEKTNVEQGAGVYSITYKPLDVSYIGSSSDVRRRWREHKSNIKITGGLDAGPCFGDNNVDNFEFKVLEYTKNYKKAEEKYINENITINFKGNNKRYYKDVRAVKVLKERPNWKLISGKQDLINLENQDIQVYDINNNWIKVKHVFKNDKSSSPYMMHIYYNEYGKKHCISATEDHPFFNGKTFTKAMDLKIGDKLYRADGVELIITDIGYHWKKVESYDIGTESGTFVGSDIKMHNCRTNNSFDINFTEDYFIDLIKETVKNNKIPDNYLLSAAQRDGRGNIAPSTIILPTLAMEAKKKTKNNSEEIVDCFMGILDTAINDCKDGLIERFNWIAAQSPNSGKFMYKNNTMKGYIPEEGIRSALKHGTLAIGQIGLAETLQILIGCDQTTKKGMELAKKIEQMFMDKCDEFKHKYMLNFGNYMTPAENLSYTSFEKFTAKYGLIENVNAYRNDKGELVSRGYFTNSIHVPVWKKISPFEKIDIESQLTGYSSAGCITYVELEDDARNNQKAVEQIINYAMDKDIPYFAINVPVDYCSKCHYQGVIEGDCCPNCGAKEYNPDGTLTRVIERLRRVTGYITGSFKVAFNLGKQKETIDRVKHSKYWEGWNK